MLAAISEWLRPGGHGRGRQPGGRGVVALAAPALVSGPWVGGAGGGPSGRVLGRALGGRILLSAWVRCSPAPRRSVVRKRFLDFARWEAARPLTSYQVTGSSRTP